MEQDGSFKDKQSAPSKTKPGSINITQQPLDQAAPSLAPLTPRIDISRASSSSYHEDSSPENVFDQVGTGILSTEATGCLGFREDGALELRSSTEELFFMEPEKGQTECEKPSGPQRMVFKFDDTHSVTLHQFQRKDSGCSEVAAFLNISGRTSRISSVGSQGSAVSRLSGLSAVSGVSRSPSPHRMLVETSFCGPKPIEPASDASSMEQISADTLEQVILARRRDPTEAVMAEGVKIPNDIKTNGAVAIKEPVIDIESKVAQKVIAFNKAEELRALKPRLNTLTVSKGAAKKENKKVVGAFPSGTQYTRIKLKDDHLYEDKGLSPNERIIDENDFSTKKKGDKKDKHVEDINQITKIGGDKQSPADARSPSPALSASVSRKTSFCSLFKSRDSSVNSDQSAGTNKKRSNSKDGGKGKNKLTDNSPTPSPKSSPMDHSKVQPKQSTSNDTGDHKSRPKSRLRYYDPPADGGAIHIPLHTPPDEKDFSIKTKPVIAILPPKKIAEKVKTTEKAVQQVSEKIETAPDAVVKPRKVGPKPPVRMYPPAEKKIEAPSVPPPAPPIIVATKPKRAPLYLPSEDRFSEDKEGASSWSVDVQRHSSQESQETVISSQINDDSSSRNGEKNATKNESVIENLPPLSTTAVVAKGRNKRHILFSTKIGSGSEEQIFMTQLSLSKTESQSSQLSDFDKMSVFESPKNEECSAKECSSNTSQDELCKITLRKQKTVKSPSETDASSKRESIRSRDSSESNRKRDSGESKKRDSGEISTITPDFQSPKSPMSSQSLTPPQPKLPESSRMEISSESDRESDVASSDMRRHHMTPRSSNQTEDHESTGLVLQGFLQESFDDELPYVPTTLPEERCSGLRIVPIKERSQIELKTCQVNRPRSTTPINPLQSLENYCERRQSDDQDAGGLVRGEKLRISLPKKGAEEKVVKGITRRISNLSNKSWTEFAEQNIQGPSVTTPLSAKNDKPLEDFPPPPLPPRKSLTSTKWIDFENIPEKRQPPKKITTIPSKDPLHEKSHASKSSQRVHYNYVDPEECQCECHEGAAHKENSPKHSPSEVTPTGKTPPTEDSQPLLADSSEKNERNSMSTDSSLEYSLEHEEQGLLQAHKPKSPSNLNLDRPFGMDLSVELGGHSNRSSIVEVSDSSAF